MFGLATLLCGKLAPQLSFAGFLFPHDPLGPLVEGSSNGCRNTQPLTLLQNLDVPQVPAVQPDGNHFPDTFHSLGSQTASVSTAPRPTTLTRYPNSADRVSENAPATHQSAKENLVLPGSVFTRTPLEPKALPPAALATLSAKYRPLIDRVLARLSEAEQREVNAHLRDDYRQAWICLNLASKGQAEPFMVSSYQMYGVHPSKVWERIVANRKARLGAEYYDHFDSSDNPRPDIPKIPAVREAEHYERLDALTNFNPSGLPVSAPDTGEGDNLPPNRKPSPVHPLSDKERFA